MALVGLLSPVDSPAGLAAFSFQHARDHDEINAALRAVGLTPPPTTPLDPMPALDNTGAWLLQHQTAHTVINGLLGLDGADLVGYKLDDPIQFEAFANENFSEHDSWHQTLGV